MATRKKAPEPEATASGIQIETKTVTTVRTTDGLPIRKGDTILLKVNDETILCTYVGLSNRGYFVTQPFDESGKEIQYRLGSISASFKIESVTFEKEKQEPADAPAADPADLQTLNEA